MNRSTACRKVTLAFCVFMALSSPVRAGELVVAVPADVFEREVASLRTLYQIDPALSQEAAVQQIADRGVEEVARVSPSQAALYRTLADLSGVLTIRDRAVVVQMPDRALRFILAELGKWHHGGYGTDQEIAERLADKLLRILYNPTRQEAVEPKTLASLGGTLTLTYEQDGWAPINP